MHVYCLNHPCLGSIKLSAQRVIVEVGGVVLEGGGGGYPLEAHH